MGNIAGAVGCWSCRMARCCRFTGATVAASSRTAQALNFKMTATWPAIILCVVGHSMRLMFGSTRIRQRSCWAARNVACASARLPPRPPQLAPTVDDHVVQGNGGVGHVEMPPSGPHPPRRDERQYTRPPTIAPSGGLGGAQARGAGPGRVASRRVPAAAHVAVHVDLQTQLGHHPPRRDGRRRRWAVQRARPTRPPWSSSGGQAAVGGHGGRGH